MRARHLFRQMSRKKEGPSWASVSETEELSLGWSAVTYGLPGASDSHIIHFSLGSRERVSSQMLRRPEPTLCDARCLTTVHSAATQTLLLIHKPVRLSSCCSALRCHTRALLGAQSGVLCGCMGHEVCSCYKPS